MMQIKAKACSAMMATNSTMKVKKTNKIILQHNDANIAKNKAITHQKNATIQNNNIQY